MIVCSDREVRAQLERLAKGSVAKALTEWEKERVKEWSALPFERLSAKQKQCISKIYFERYDVVGA